MNHQIPGQSLSPAETSCWTLQATAGHFSAGSFSAAVDLAHPERGLAGLLPAGGVLGVSWPTVDTAAGRIVESYGRGGDLIVAYAPTPDWPFRLTLYWRFGFSPPVQSGDWAVDLQISIQTQLLDTHPQVLTVSALPAGEVLVMDPASGEFSAVGNQTNPAPAEFPSGALLVRPSASPDRSYLQILHPSDLEASVQPGPQSTWNTEGEQAVIRQRLFGDYLEKGVIRRGRLRAVVLNRSGDTLRGAEYYRQFEAATLPLTT